MAEFKYKRTRAIVKTNDNKNKETRAARVGIWLLLVQTAIIEEDGRAYH